MKKIVGWVVLFVVLGAGLFAWFSQEEPKQYLRIHIRANSNSVQDQTVKYAVKDEVVEFLTPLLAQCENFEEVKTMLEQELSQIEQVANSVLEENGFLYTASANVNNEYFPSRYYDDILLTADYYDALIIGLGTATGDNWWCVVYPPLCFVGGSGSGNVVYKSLLVEMIEKFFA